MTEWTPLLGTLVAAIPILVGIYFARRPSKQQQQDATRQELELIVHGALGLLAEVQEERSECQRRLQECLDAHRKTTAVDA